MAGPSTSTSKSDAFFNSAWCFSAPSAPFTSSSSSSTSAPYTSSSSSFLLVPPASLGRRASDSALPPPCALDRPSLFRSRLSSTGSTSKLQSNSIPGPARRPLSPLVDAAGQRGSVEPVASTSAMVDSTSLASETAHSDASCSRSTTSSVVSEIEKRLEEAVRQMETSAVQEVQDSEMEDDDNMYYNDSADAASTMDRDADKPFIPLFPLQPLDTIYAPQHRQLTKPLRKALRAIARATSSSAQEEEPQPASRRVTFANCVEVVDVFAAADYVGRKGPPPLERLTMRDILELRQIKIELGVHGKNDPSAGDEDEDGTPSTPFEKMNIFESTPLSPSSSLAPTSPFRTDFGVPSLASSSENTTNTSSAASSYQSGLSSTSLSASTSSSSYFDSPASFTVKLDTYSHVQGQESGPSTVSSGSVVFLDPKASHLLRERDRDTSPDSIGATSAFSSPSLSLSCSPSASDSEFFYSTEGDERDTYGLEDDQEEEEYDDAVKGQDEDNGGNETFRVAEFGHSRKAVRLKSTTPPKTRRSRNADYFKVALPVLSRCSTDTSDIGSITSETQENAKSAALPPPIAVEPIILLDRPWGLQS